MSTNVKWGNKTKATASAVPTTVKKDRGTRYEGVIESATPVAFKTGSFGLKIKYVVNGLERALYENVVLTKMTDEGMPTPTMYGEATFKRRLQAAGMTSDEVNAFKIPKTIKHTEGLERLTGAKVAVYAIQTEYLGRPSFDVKSVFPLDNNLNSDAEKVAY